MAEKEKIKLILYQNEIKQEYESEIIITKDNSYSLQNKGDLCPVMTIAMNEDGDLMMNTNSSEYIKNYIKEKPDAKA